MKRRFSYAGPAIGLCFAVLSAGSVSAFTRDSSREVIVVASGSTVDAAQTVERSGGKVLLKLPIVSGFAARVPEASIPALERSRHIAAVRANDRVSFAEEAVKTSTVNSVYTRETNADKLWAKGITGKRVVVALVDTGIHSGVPAIASKVIPVKDPFAGGQARPCIDLSGESHCDDSYGHGTFLAGLIAASPRSDGAFGGMAPDARLVSIKIAGKDGSADVTKVLAAIQWVVSYKDTYGIKVLNLSLGTTGRAHPTLDPLNLAVQRAWDAGLTVVVSAGNRGPAKGTISKPADDPLVITAGAVDDRETPAIDDDRLPRFSSRGPTAHGISKPDVVAPGARLVSFRAPGSLIEQKAPGGVDATYRRGSGTSMSAAVVSGAAALMLEANPALTPDRVKLSLMATARKVAERDINGIGAGLVDIFAATNAQPPVTVQPRHGWHHGASLDETRGEVFVTRPCTPFEQAAGATTCKLSGEVTAQGRPFYPEDYQKSWTEDSYRTSQWFSVKPEGSSWYDIAAQGSSWYGSSWYDIGTEGSSWYGSSWYGSSWYGSEDATWYGTSLQGSSWYGAWQ